MSVSLSLSLFFCIYLGLSVNIYHVFLYISLTVPVSLLLFLFLPSFYPHDCFSAYLSQPSVNSSSPFHHYLPYCIAVKFKIIIIIIPSYIYVGTSNHTLINNHASFFLSLNNLPSSLSCPLLCSFSVLLPPSLPTPSYQFHQPSLSIPLLSLLTSLRRLVSVA